MAGIDQISHHENTRIATIVETIPSAAVATDRNNLVVALNGLFGDLVKRSADEILGVNLFQLLDARDIFGNVLNRENEGLHEMVQSFELVKDFKLNITTGEERHLFVGVSIVIVLEPDSDDYHLIYLTTQIQRRRRSDQFLDQILVGVGAGTDGTYVGEEARGMAEVFRLTARQKEVLRLLADGKNSNEISDILCLSIHTIRSHIQKILRVLEVNSQLEAVTKALTLRIL
ncbi:MAG: LuxR C-terminal-related transcriptional regulator [Acidobacteriota bacterium]